MPNFKGGLRGALFGINLASPLVSALLREDWQRSLLVIREHLAQRGIDWLTLSARWSAGFAAAGNNLSSPAPAERQTGLSLSVLAPAAHVSGAFRCSRCQPRNPRGQSQRVKRLLARFRVRSRL